MKVNKIGNTRKNNFHIDEDLPIGIHAIYKDKNGIHDEVFDNDTINDFKKIGENDLDAVKNIYKYFNNTLRPDQSYRKFIKAFWIYPSQVFRKIDLYKRNETT